VQCAQLGNGGKGFGFGAPGEVESCVAGVKQGGEGQADAGVAAGYDVDLEGVLGWWRWIWGSWDWGERALPVWSGRCLVMKVGAGMKKDWSQKEESF
jgi:hypothetical protein